jgi:F-type H+-transporting ATPase subunit b
MSQEAHTAANAVEAAAHGTEAAAQGAEHGASGGFPPFDVSLFPHQLFWFAVSFGALYLLLAFVILPKISATLASRKGQIEADLQAAALETQQAEAAKLASEKAQAEAKNSARSKLDAMRKSVGDEAQAAQAKALAEAEASIKASEAAINAQKEDALAVISDEVMDIASAIYQQFIGKAPTATVVKAVTKGAK